MKTKRSPKQTASKQNASDVSSDISKKDTSPRVHQREKINFNLNIKGLDWTEKQKAFIELATHKDTRVVFLSGPAGTSKAQPLDAKLLTPNGWRLMGDIQPGDKVYGRDGTPVKVISIHPQGIQDIFKVTFSDGTSTECTDDHLWLTKTYYDRTFEKTRETVRLSRQKRGLRELKHSQARIDSSKNGTVKTLKEIRETLYVGGSENINHTIPIVDVLQFPAREHIIHPYIMGVLLGDGCLRTRIGITSADSELVERVREFLPSDMQLKYLDRPYEYKIMGKERSTNYFLKELARMELRGKYSYNKCIPDEYLFDSQENRLWLLKGLMDTDGFAVSKQSYVGFCSTSVDLMDGVRFLVESLGGVCSAGHASDGNDYMYNGELRKGRPSWSFFVNLPVNPFSLSRKQVLVKQRTKYFPQRYITNVEYVGQKEAQCILVDSAEHLYLTNNCIVTHNTALAVFCALQLINTKRASELVYVRSLVESASQSLGSLPGEMGEKFKPFAMPLIDKLEEFLCTGDIKKLFADERVKPTPVNYLRGASYNANVVIVDEAQNLDFNKELVTVITRIGKFSKFFILGDPMQTDLKHKEQSGFKPMFDLFNDEQSQKEGIYCVEFTKDDIMRSELLKFIVEKIENYQAIKKQM